MRTLKKPNNFTGSDNEQNPLVSIIVPCYNHDRFINQCIDSIYNQTYKNFELIVIDDGSKDNSPNLLKQLQLKYGFYLRIQENQGIAFNLNHGIKEFSSGKYITFCASDDYWTPDKLKIQVDFMENNRYYPMCYGKTYYVDEESNVIKNEDVNNLELRGGALFDDIFLFKLHPPVNYMFRSEIFDEVGLYDEGIIAEDYYMNLKISNKYSIGFINEYLGYYRLTGVLSKIERWENVSNSHLMSIELFSNHNLFNKAKRMVFLRKFCNFASFSRYKIKSIRYLYKSIFLFYHKLFIIGCLNLVFKWQK